MAVSVSQPEHPILTDAEISQYKYPAWRWTRPRRDLPPPIVELDHLALPAELTVDAIQAQLIAKGWCPHAVEALSYRFRGQLCVLAYLLSLRRHPARINVHAGCESAGQCIAFNTTLASYDTKHTTETCTCVMVETPYIRLKEILLVGGIPLISIEGGEGTGEPLTLGVHERTMRTEYIAVSHVWADGLGNPTANALPSCQIEKLRKSMTALLPLTSASSKKRALLLWMDTLCIPVRPDGQHLRPVQIDKMASVYGGASLALVLDLELMSTKLKVFATPADPNTPLHMHRDCRAYIACSAWMSRSWTYQEGFLPASVAFQFSQGLAALGSSRKDLFPVSIGRMIFWDDLHDERFIVQDASEACEPSPSPSHFHELGQFEEHASMSSGLLSGASVTRICDCVYMALVKSTQRILSHQNQFNAFIIAWGELAWRSTSMPEDVIMVLANSVSLETSGLARYHSMGDKLLALLLSLDRLPLSLLYNSNLGHDQHGNHVNNRYLVEVGKPRLYRPINRNTPVTISLGSYLEVKKSYLLFKIDTNLPYQASARIIDGSWSCRSDKMLYVSTPGERAVYIIHHHCNHNNSEHFDTTDHTETCIIHEPISGTDFADARGSLFGYRVIGALKSWHRLTRPIFELKYHCSVTVTYIKEDEFEDLDVESMDQVYSLPEGSECKILYDTPHDFERLKSRGFSEFNDRDIVIIMIIGACASFGWVLHDFRAHWAKYESGGARKLALNALAGFVFGCVGTLVLIPISMFVLIPMSIRLRRLWYIRALGDVAQRQERG